MVVGAVAGAVVMPDGPNKDGVVALAEGVAEADENNDANPGAPVLDVDGAGPNRDGKGCVLEPVVALAGPKSDLGAVAVDEGAAELAANKLGAAAGALEVADGPKRLGSGAAPGVVPGI